MIAQVHTKVLKNIYQSLLPILSQEEILAIFENHSLTPSLSGTSPFEKIRFLCGKSDFINYDEAARFVYDIHKRVPHTVRLPQVQGNENIVSTFILKSLAKVGMLFHQSRDPRIFMLQELLEKGTDSLTKGAVHRYYHRPEQSTPEINRGYSILINDLEYRERYAALNAQRWVIDRIQAIPKVLGYPPFESITYAVTEESFEDILPDDDFQRNSSGEILYHNELLGEKISLHSYMREQNFDYEDLSIPDEEVYLAMRDITDESGELLITKGAIYKSSITVLSYEYAPVKKITADTVPTKSAPLIQEKEILPLHKKLMECEQKINSEYLITFDRESQRLFFDDTVSTKGIQAEILRYILREFTNKERTLFYFKEFCDEQSFPYIQTMSSFVNRYNRITALLEKNKLPIQLLKKAKGSFELSVQRSIRFIDKE